MNSGAGLLGAPRRIPREGLSICINTQTPLVQYLNPPRRRWWGRRAPRSGEIETLTEGKDFRYSPGGVTRMVLPLVRQLKSEGLVGHVHWVSLNPGGPPTANLGDVILHNVTLDKSQMSGYGAVKETMWRLAHGLRLRDSPSGTLWTDEFSEFAYYNRSTAELMRRLDREWDFDVFYIHDFQQLPTGGMLDPVKPKVLRWHIPFSPTMVPPEWKATFLEYLRHYDTVVVSTDRYARALRTFGHTGTVRRIYPFLDPNDYSNPPEEEVDRCCAKWGIGPRDDVVLVVARMDPAKGQDTAIRATARLRRSFPRLKLVLVGNGSFSGSRSGLGLSKSEVWRNRLLRLIRHSGLESRVILTGHVDQHELDCLYERSLFTILPSYREGFGLVVVESWLHRRPALVSDQAGVMELVEPGRNGLLFDPRFDTDLAGRIESLLSAGPELRRKWGEAGRETARACFLDRGIRDEKAMLLEAIEAP